MTTNGNEPSSNVGGEETGKCEGADIEQLENVQKLFPLPPKPKKSTFLSENDFTEFKEHSSRDYAWETLVKTHNADLLERQAKLTTTVKLFWKRIIATYNLNTTSNFSINVDTGEIVEVPRLIKKEIKNV